MLKLPEEMEKGKWVFVIQEEGNVKKWKENLSRDSVIMNHVEMEIMKDKLIFSEEINAQEEVSSAKGEFWDRKISLGGTLGLGPRNKAEITKKGGSHGGY